jgi:hypothetical protein
MQAQNKFKNNQFLISEIFTGGESVIHKINLVWPKDKCMNLTGM